MLEVDGGTQIFSPQAFGFGYRRLQVLKTRPKPCALTSHRVLGILMLLAGTQVFRKYSIVQHFDAGVHLLVSQYKETPIQTPEHYNPDYADLVNGTRNFCKRHLGYRPPGCYSARDKLCQYEPNFISIAAAHLH